MNLSENIYAAIREANTTGPQGYGSPFGSILKGVVLALARVASQHDVEARWYR